MTTFLAQNQFISNPSVISPRTERSAVASKPPPAADATAAPFQSSDGEDHANLQNMHSTSSTRGFSYGAESERRPDGNMQILPEAKASRQTYSRKEVSEGSFEGKISRSGPGCSSTREDVEAAALPELQHGDAGTPLGCSSPGLLKTTGSSLALPSMSWDRASFLETGCLEAAGIEADGRVEGHAEMSRSIRSDAGRILGCETRRGHDATIADIKLGPSEALPSNERRPQEASAPAPTKNPDADALDLTDCISEIFFYARKLVKQPPRFVLDQARFLAEIEEVPLFVREGEHLRRWSA